VQPSLAIIAPEDNDGLGDIVVVEDNLDIFTPDGKNLG